MNQGPIIERIARRLCILDGKEPDTESAMSDTLTTPEAKLTPAWKTYESQAREILTDIREPTELMVAAGQRRKEEDTNQWNGRCYVDPADIWQEMIDTALRGW